VPNADGVSVGSRFVPDEVGVALKLARGTAAGRVGTACRLLAVLPATHALWEAGLIDTGKARAVDEATAVLPDDLARAVQARVLPRAPEQSLAQLRAALARAIIAVDPDGAAARHRTARTDRRVCRKPLVQVVIAQTRTAHRLFPCRPRARSVAPPPPLSAPCG
jgi:hypothetical protein